MRTSISAAAATLFAVGLVAAPSLADAELSYRIKDLGTLGGSYSTLRALNTSGQVTGYSAIAGDRASHAFLWNGSSMVDLGTLGGAYSHGWSINESGQVAGYSQSNSGEHAFLWDGTNMVDLGTIDGGTSRCSESPQAINASGQVVGESVTLYRGTHAFLWDGTTMVDLGTLGGSRSVATAINDAGQVTGYAATGTPDDAVHAFLWDGGSMLDLGTLGGRNSMPKAINASGQVAGSSSFFGDTTSRAFLWNGTELLNLGTLGGQGSEAADINDAGQVTGYAYTADGGAHAFFWNGTSMVDLGTLGGRYSFAADINAAGKIIGFSKTEYNEDRAFLWDGIAMRDLNHLIEVSDPLKPYVVFTKAVAINDRDQIIALGCDSRTTGCTYYLLSPPAADTTPPVVVPTVTGTLGNDGWYVSDVLVVWAVTDAESAISETTGCNATSVTTDAGGITLTCSATSWGGTTTESVSFKRDSTPPNASATAEPPANAFGWRNQNVTVTFSGTDGMSGGVTCDAQTVVSTEGSNQSVSGRCYDAAGNQSNLVTASGISIDTTAPTISIVAPVEGAVYKRNKKPAVTVNYSCNDALSGIHSCQGPVNSGQMLDTSDKVNNASFTVNAEDNAGNSYSKVIHYSVK